MLSLRQGLGLDSVRGLGGSWTPSDDNVVAWYKNKTGITLSGSDVSAWADSSSNSYDMVQATATKQPAYNASTGVLTFDDSDVQNLQSSGQISLSGAFTVGIRCNPSTFNNVLVGDNTSSNEFFKYTSSSNIRVKIDGNVGNLPLDSGTFDSGILTIVITRNGSDVVTLHKNGVAQSTTATVAGTADIDAIGIRNPDINSYDGDISEIQIFDSTSSALTTNINTYLSAI